MKTHMLYYLSVLVSVFLIACDTPSNKEDEETSEFSVTATSEKKKGARTEFAPKDAGLFAEEETEGAYVYKGGEFRFEPGEERDTVEVSTSIPMEDIEMEEGTIPLLVAKIGNDSQFLSLLEFAELDTNTKQLKVEFSVVVPAKQELKLMKKGIKMGNLYRIKVGLMGVKKNIAGNIHLKLSLVKGGSESGKSLFVFVHGLKSDSEIWTNLINDKRLNMAHARVVVADYASCVPIADNGQALAKAMDNLDFIDDMESIQFVVHSMGGLVTRKALYEAEKKGYNWVKKAKTCVFFSTPHDGSPLARNTPLEMLSVSKNPYKKAIASLKTLTGVCVGIVELRYGYMHREWVWKPWGLWMDVSKETPLPRGISVFAAVDKYDGVVPMNSAFDRDGKYDALNLGAEIAYKTRSGDYYKNRHAVYFDENTCENICDLSPKGIEFNLLTQVIRIKHKKSCGVADYKCNAFTAHASYDREGAVKLLQAWLKLPIPPTIRFSKPQEDDIWIEGERYDIKWNESGDKGKTVDIHLYQGADYLRSVKIGTSNNGRYSWRIPSGLDHTAEYRIKIVDNQASDVSEYSEPFQISPPPKLTLTLPNASSKVQEGNTLEIKWKSIGFPGNSVKLELSQRRNSKNKWTITSGTRNDGSYKWKLPSSVKPGSRYRVTISALKTGVTNESEEFSITSKPSIEITAPKSGQTYTTGRTMEVRWNSYGNTGSRVVIAIYQNGHKHTTLMTKQNEGEFHWEIPEDFPSGTKYAIRVTSKLDSDYEDQSGLFSINPAPKLELNFPDDKSQFLPGDQIQIKWGKEGKTGANVQLKLHKGSSAVATISKSAPNSGNFLYTLPKTLVTGNDYHITISSISPSGIQGKGPSFSINVTPEIRLNTLSKTQFTIGETLPLEWSLSGNVGKTVELVLIQNNKKIVSLAKTDVVSKKYNWKVLGTVDPGTNFQIKIVSVSSDDVHDFSEAFSIHPVPTLSMNKLMKENYHIGESVLVTWDASGDVGASVDIYLFQNNAKVKKLGAQTTSKKSFDWPIPSSASTGSGYQIRLLTSKSFKATSQSFSISAVPAIHIQSPKTGEEYQPGATLPIRWTSNAAAGASLSLTLIPETGSDLSISGSTSNDGALDWTLPMSLVPGRKYSIKARSLSKSVEHQSGFFTVIPKPSLSITKPTEGSSYFTLNSIFINWVVTGNTGTTVDIVLYRSNTQIQSVADDTPNDGAFGWVLPAHLDAATDYRFKLTTSNGAQGFSKVFEVEKEPALTILTPGDDSDYYPGQQIPIKWENAGVKTASAYIALYRASTLVMAITSATKNDGEYLWDIPDSLSAGSDYRIYILNKSNTRYNGYGSYFNIMESEKKVFLLIYKNDFNSLDNLTLFGLPAPVLSTRTPDGSGFSFDNNGDAMYNSGAIINGYSFDYRYGGRMDAEFYVSSNTSGCWLGSSLIVGERTDVSATQDAGHVFGMVIEHIGDACHQSPVEQRRRSHLRFFFRRASDEKTVSYSQYFDPAQYNDKWVKLMFDISKSGDVKCLADGKIVWQPTDKISIKYYGNPLWIGHRSSSYGDGLVDNIRIWEFR